jgi:hypothetical protein
VRKALAFGLWAHAETDDNGRWVVKEARFPLSGAAYIVYIPGPIMVSQHMMQKCRPFAPKLWTMNVAVLNFSSANDRRARLRHGALFA